MGVLILGFSPLERKRAHNSHLPTIDGKGRGGEGGEDFQHWEGYGYYDEEMDVDGVVFGYLGSPLHMH